MQVKTIPYAIIAVFLIGCGGGGGGLLPVRTLELPVRRPVGIPGVFATHEALFAVLADAESASLQVFKVPRNSFDASGEKPSLDFADKISAGPVHEPDFGACAGSGIGGVVHLLYLDRRREAAPVLKWLRREDGGAWFADVIETDTPALPVAVVNDGTGNAIPVWIEGSSLRARMPGGELRVVASTGAAGSLASAPGRGFIYPDPASGDLGFFVLREGSFDRIGLGSGAVAYCVGASADGGHAVMTYSPEAKRLFLYESTADGAGFVRTTVASAQGTHLVYFSPFRGAYAFIFDGISTRKEAGFRYRLSVLVPGGGTYREFGVIESIASLGDFAALLEGQNLYVAFSGETGAKCAEVLIPN